jgi:hypothetical protein
MLGVSKMSKTTANQPKGEYEYLLAQMIYCHHCLDRMTQGGAQAKGVLVPYYIHRRMCKKSLDCGIPPNINARRLDEVVWERVAKNISDADLRRWTEVAQSDTNIDGVEEIKAGIAEDNCALKAKQGSHASILKALGGGGDADEETRKMLGLLANDIKELRQRLAEKKGKLAEAKKEAEAKKDLKPAKMRVIALRDLDASQKRDLLKLTLNRVELLTDTIILQPYTGDPIIGELQPPKKGIRSGVWRFIDVKWLN